MSLMTRLSSCPVPSPAGDAGDGMCPGQRMRTLATPFPQLEGRHPCFSVTAAGHARSGRLHLPVSPGCNIACRFCKRDFNETEHRPGVARRLLSPEAALEVVHRALALCPSITVVGIAGPGDTLFTDHALRTFALVHAAYPHLINCLSTNGLLLPDKAEAVVAAGVETVTVTVNAVDPVIEAQITPTIVHDHRRIDGEAGATRLIAHQIEGIRRVTALGAVVKVNTVLIPGINDDHIATIAQTVAEAGASMINIIPLLPQHDFATLPAPSPLQLSRAQAAARQHLTVFSHCQRCRADACGIPGVSDFADALYGSGVTAASTFSHG
ncbi:MAG: radical SAM protein [Azospirillaceae bacterium]|nr:radical SAM protein [Azospirillaceae bacterium]